MGVSSYLLCAKYSAKMRIKMDKILEKWDEILSTVKHEHDISDISFDTWIRPLEVYGVEGSTLYILVPSEQMTLSYISKKYYLPLKVTIAELTGTESSSSCRNRQKISAPAIAAYRKKMHFPKRRTDQI